MSEEQEQTTLEPGEPEDRVNVINVARIEKAKIVELNVEELPEDAFSSEPFEEKETEDGEEPRPAEKIHPVLAESIANRPGDTMEEILINFVDPIQIPRFPSLNPDESPDS
jgi:hypothetical protein